MSISSLKLTLISVLAILCASCSRDDRGSAIPRRPAYPRAAEYPAEYVAVDSLPFHIEANAKTISAVERMRDGAVWLNIDYPDYRARVYFTFTPVDAATVEAALENRAERIGLNLGNASVESEHFTTESGYYVTLIKAPQALPTPAHFLAVDTQEPTWLVSGAAVLHGVGPDAPADSIAPVIDTIYRDISHAMTRLAPAQ